MTRRRERWSISGAILGAIHSSSLDGRSYSLSALAVRANLSYDRLSEYLAELEAQGLVSMGRPPRLTPRGRAFLDREQQWIGLLSRYGFVEAQDPRPESANVQSAPAALVR